jgi:hypothetical protein
MELARREGLAVEVVIFADTVEYPGLDFHSHVSAVAKAVGSSPGVVIELANENRHSTQDRRLVDPAFLVSLRKLLPATLPVSLGSLHAGDDRLSRYPGGDYVTVHIDRSGDGWDHVSRVADLAQLAQKAGMPVVSDEPMGAAERDERRRRLSDPAVFFGLGVLGRMSSIPSTFHCEDCMYCRIPAKVQDACARAFVRGYRTVPEGLLTDIEPRLSKVRGGPIAGEPVPGVRFLHAATDKTGNNVIVAAVGVSGRLDIPWSRGWSARKLGEMIGIAVFHATPSQRAGEEPRDERHERRGTVLATNGSPD